MDVDGTLLDFDRAEAAAFTKVLQKYGFVPEERFIQEYHKINQECWEAFEIGQMERDRVLTVRFERFFGGHGLSMSGEEAEDAYRVWLGGGSGRDTRLPERALSPLRSDQRRGSYSEKTAEGIGP